MKVWQEISWDSRHEGGSYINEPSGGKQDFPESLPKLEEDAGNPKVFWGFRQCFSRIGRNCRYLEADFQEMITTPYYLAPGSLASIKDALRED